MSTATTETMPVGKASPGKLAVLYDGSCELCLASMEAISRFDNADAVEGLNLHHASATDRFPSLDRPDLLAQLHAIDDRGRIYRGARAINEILRRQRGLVGLLAYIWYLPGFAMLADWQYRRIAGSRYEHQQMRRSGPDLPGSVNLAKANR